MSTTDWKPYDVPALAALLAEQPTDSGIHAMAWQQAYETLTDQRQQIQAARAALTQAWPAAPGSAAESFLDQVDAITQAMSNTAETAVNAHGALTGIVTAIDNATTKVDTLHQSWQQNQTAIGDTVPTSDWTQPLNDHAHTVMGQADAAIAEHTTQLAPPVPYVPISGSDSFTPFGSPPRAPSKGNLSRSSADNLPTAMGGASVDVSSRATGTVVEGRVALSTPIANESGNVGFHVIALTGAPSSAMIDRKGDRSSIRRTQPSAGGANSGTGQGGSRIIGPSSAHPRMSGPRSVRTEEPLAGSAHSLEAAPVSGSSFGGSGNRSASTPETVSTDGVALTTGSRGARTNVSDTGASVGEPMPGGGFLASGAGAVSQNPVRNHRGGQKEIAWPMPVGVRPIIEVRGEVAIHHDPGTGVVGIDL